MKHLKKIFLHNWHVKLVCLLLATMIWYLFKQKLPQRADAFRAIPAATPEPTPKATPTPRATPPKPTPRATPARTPARTTTPPKK